MSVGFQLLGIFKTGDGGLHEVCMIYFFVIFFW